MFSFFSKATVEEMVDASYLALKMLEFRNAANYSVQDNKIQNYAKEIINEIERKEGVRLKEFSVESLNSSIKDISGWLSTAILNKSLSQADLDNAEQVINSWFEEDQLKISGNVAPETSIFSLSKTNIPKKIEGYIKLQIPAGAASPAPPIGPALGQHGVNIMEFCRAFNAKTQNMDKDVKIPVVITVYGDRSFSFVTKAPAAADLLRKVSGIAKGSGAPNKTKVGNFNRAQIEEVVRGKLQESDDPKITLENMSKRKLNPDTRR